MSAHDVTGPAKTHADALGATMAATMDDDGSPPPRPSDTETLPSRELGRYVVLERLGAGAMGVVLAAYDPELDRKVAIKLLHPRERGSKSDDGRLRLLAEAQALARLADPNVVAVHDVGTHEGQVFVAMEFVEGQTLGHWLAQGRHPWSEVLDMMIPAGRGLATAHAHDLVHRDFKPDNVMLGDDGRVRVMDFGLARADGDGDGSTADGDIETSQPRTRALELGLTNLGTLLGTPAYMPPEQLSGARGGPLADQFSFCASLWEGLYGQLPFAGDTFPALCTSVLDGTITEPPAGSRVPGWLRRVVERGLAVEPERRWPSMRALLHALERGRVRARRKHVLAAGALVLTAGAGVWGVQRYQQLQGERACAAEGASIEQVWSDDAAAIMREALVGTGVSHAEVTMDKVRPWLDAQAHGWQEARTEACTSAEVHGTWSAQTYQRAQWCLDDRRMELEALIAELSRGEQWIVDHAVSAATGLDPIGPCTDGDFLARMPVAPADAHEEVRDIRAALWRLEALEQLGAYEEGLPLAWSTLARAETLGWLPLVAAARYQVGELLARTADFTEALHQVEDAYFEAARAESFELAAVAASRMTGILGYELSRHDDALRWARHGELMLSSLPDPGGLLRASRLVNIANVYYSMGSYERSMATNEEALHIYEQVLAPDHVSIADVLTNLGIVSQAQGAYAEAKDLYERALRVREHALGSSHPSVAEALNNLGTVFLSLGELEQAKALFERAIAIQEASLGPDHPDLVNPLNNLASLHFMLEEHEAAQRLYERAARVAEQSLGPSHPRLAGILYNLGDCVRMRGDLARAQGLFERALQLYEATNGPEHPDLAYPLHGLASIAWAQGRFELAVELAQRALRLREAGGVASDLVAESRFLLARVQWSYGQARPEALAQARRAAEEYREHGEAKAVELAEIEEWLAEQPPP